MNVSLTEKGEDNDNSGDRGVGGIHSGVSVVLGGRLIVGGDIQRLRSILPYTSIEVIFESPYISGSIAKLGHYIGLFRISITSNLIGDIFGLFKLV